MGRGRVPGARRAPTIRWLPLLTGMRAYGAWVRGEFDLAVALARRDPPARSRLRRGAERAGRAGVRQRALHRQPSSSRATRSRRDRSSSREASGEPLALRPRLLHGVGRDERRPSDSTKPRRSSSRPDRCALTTGSPTDLASAAVAEGFASHGDVDAALEAFGTARATRERGRQPVDDAFATHRGERAARAPRRARRGCAGLAEMVGIWSPRRRLVAAVAHAGALRDRAAPHGPGRAGGGAARRDRGARDARRGADDLDAARRRLRDPRRARRRARRRPRRPSSATAGASSPGRDDRRAHAATRCSWPRPTAPPDQTRAPRARVRAIVVEVRRAAVPIRSAASSPSTGDQVRPAPAQERQSEHVEARRARATPPSCAIRPRRSSAAGIEPADTTAGTRSPRSPSRTLARSSSVGTVAEPGRLRAGPEPRPRRRGRARSTNSSMRSSRRACLRSALATRFASEPRALRRAPDDPHQATDERDAAVRRGR